MKRILTAYRLGRVEYEDGLRLQAAFAAARKAGTVGDVLLLLEHAPVLTLGRGADRGDILRPAAELEARGVEVHETDRGGEVTYHGPAQIVGYPILDLAPERKDVRRYVRSVEEGMIRALAEQGIEANLGAQCVSAQPSFAACRPADGSPTAQRLFRQGLALPFCEQYGAAEVARVTGALGSVLEASHA